MIPKWWLARSPNCMKTVCIFGRKKLKSFGFGTQNFSRRESALLQAAFSKFCSCVFCFFLKQNFSKTVLTFWAFFVKCAASSPAAAGGTLRPHARVLLQSSVVSAHPCAGKPAECLSHVRSTGQAAVAPLPGNAASPPMGALAPIDQKKLDSKMSFFLHLKIHPAVSPPCGIFQCFRFFTFFSLLYLLKFGHLPGPTARAP